MENNNETQMTYDTAISAARESGQMIRRKRWERKTFVFATNPGYYLSLSDIARTRIIPVAVIDEIKSHYDNPEAIKNEILVGHVLVKVFRNNMLTAFEPSELDYKATDWEIVQPGFQKQKR